MQKQLIILFAVLIAVFAAIGCTDTEDQPVDNETATPDVDIESGDVDVNTTPPDVDVESGDIDANVTPPDVDVENVPDVEVDTENVTVPVPDVDVENVPEVDVDADVNVTTDVVTGENIIEITDNGFDPSDIEISVGESVTWTNEDNTIHSVVADDDTFDSGELDEGEEFSYTFDEAGIYQYGSDEDPSFDGIVTVTDQENMDTVTTDTSDNMVVPADS